LTFIGAAIIVFGIVQIDKGSRSKHAKQAEIDYTVDTIRTYEHVGTYDLTHINYIGASML